MPFVNTLEILKDAKKNKYAVGAFNVFSLDHAAAIIRLCDSLGSPVLITEPAVLEPYLCFKDLGSLTKNIASQVSVPVGLHLSHGSDIATIKRVIDAGFTSAMIDGSSLSFEENIRLTKEAAVLAHKSGVTIEGELGAVGNTAGSIASSMTDPVLAKKYVSETGIDILAVSIGNSHGFYKGTPKLDFQRFEDIKNQFKDNSNLYFTLHGGTGIADSDLARLIANEMTKICIYTEMCGAGKDKAMDYLARHPNYGGTKDVPELFKSIAAGFLSIVEHDINVFGSCHKSALTGAAISASELEKIVRQVISNIKL